MENQNKNQSLSDNGNLFGFGDDLDINHHSIDFEKEINLNLPKEEEEDSSAPKKTDEKKTDAVTISRSKIILIKKLLSNIKENNDRLLEMLAVILPSDEEESIGLSQIGEENQKAVGEEINEIEGVIIEGVFDGENMIGPDGKQYSVPANYASKSKLVEGDIMKLTITPKGTFIYKQIGPIERTRIVGTLEKDGDGGFKVKSEAGEWRVLPASVTYFKGNNGDETIILVPKTGDSKWAAVENIIRKPS